MKNRPDRGGRRTLAFFGKKEYNMRIIAVRRAEAALERRKRGGKNADFTIQMQKMRKAFRRVGEIAHGYGGVPRLRRRNAARLFGRNVFRYGKTDKKMHGALRHVRGMSLNSVRTGYRRGERVFCRFYLAAGNCGKGIV